RRTANSAPMPLPGVEAASLAGGYETMSESVRTIAILTARRGKTQDLQALLFWMAPRCRAEPGNIRWDVWRDAGDADRFVLDEAYRDAAAGAAHRETPHYRDYRSKIDDLADRMVVALEPAAVA